MAHVMLALVLTPEHYEGGVAEEDRDYHNEDRHGHGLHCQRVNEGVEDLGEGFRGQGGPAHGFRPSIHAELPVAAQLLEGWKSLVGGAVVLDVLFGALAHFGDDLGHLLVLQSVDIRADSLVEGVDDVEEECEYSKVENDLKIPREY